MRVFVLALVLAACSDPMCVTRTQIYEGLHSDSQAEQQEVIDNVQARRREGYDCPSTPIRNAFGTEIGVRFTCTKCD